MRMQMREWARRAAILAVLAMLMGGLRPAWAQAPDPIVFGWAVERGDVKTVRAWLDAGLAREHQRLFVGPAALPAPPWGSVYLDEESVLFGDSTRALQAFAGRHGIALETGQREPLDHFGLVCWLVAHAAEASDEAAVHELLCEHLLPWSGRFLSLFEEASAGTPFYQAAAGLARLTLDALQTGWPASVAPSVPGQG